MVWNLSAMLMLAMTLHNFPEGMAVGSSMRWGIVWLGAVAYCVCRSPGANGENGDVWRQDRQRTIHAPVAVVADGRRTPAVKPQNGQA